MTLPRCLQPPEWLQAADALPPSLIFHTKGPHADRLLQGGFQLLSALAGHAAQAGWGVEAVTFTPASPMLAAADSGRHLHILMEDHPAYGPRVFHAVPGYLRGWWFFDEVATRNNSSIRLRHFDPRTIKPDFAQRFCDRLRTRFAGRNFSKFPQEQRGSQPVPEDCLAVFAQGFKVPPHQTHHMGVLPLIHAVIAARDGRPVVIKPHPKNTLEELSALEALHDPGAGVHVMDASIHDILAACLCAISVTSAVAFEGFLHGKPAVVAGQVDFAQNLVTLTDPNRMAEAIAAALARDWPHDRFVTWYLRHNCVEDRAESLTEILGRLHRKGIRLGDQGPGFY
ncbi:hypothetical protein [Gemmobacter denitrificans]|uniref:Capsular polysaccharide biosynthesis protein n=1 Tax=Gemmobacter denitrificans TaxID=3123040 RepID=A0ABU8BQH0_9RHOB